MTTEHSSKDLGHLGIVSVVCDQIGLVEAVDEMIPPDPRAEMTTGEAVKLMVINGLGFSSKPLYLESMFFNCRPVKRFLNREFNSEQITDDRLGRALDRCYEANCTKLFASIAMQASTLYSVNTRFRHLDTTSMSVHGNYDTENSLGLIEFGYSKDKRTDLKQFMISMISSSDGDIPLLAQTISGNTSDKKHFREALKSLKEQMDPNDPFYFVADSALYTQETIRDISEEKRWITRVPENIKAAKEVIRSTDSEHMQYVSDGYSIAKFGSIFGDIQQRWLVVFSEKALARESKTLERRFEREMESKRKELKKLCSKEFHCKEDALTALGTFKKKLKLVQCADHTLEERAVYPSKGRPKKDAVAQVRYLISTSLMRDQDSIDSWLSRKGKFIIATNELDEGNLSDTDLLQYYKKQQSVERGFRFLKDPLFLTSSVFLKKEKRIVALGMIMCLCLLVYTLAQRLLRQKIADQESWVADQKGKPTTRPTMRWVFQVFEGVHLLIIEVRGIREEKVLNLNEDRLRVLRILGPPFRKIYENAA